MLAVRIAAAGTAQSEFGKGKGRGIFRPDHNSLPPGGSCDNGSHTKAPSSDSPLPPGRQLRQRRGSDDHRSATRRSLALFPLLDGGKGEGTPRRPHLAQLLTVVRGRFHGRQPALPQLSLQLLEPLAQALQLRYAAASAATQPLLLGLFVRHLHTPLRRVRTWVT